MNIELKKRINTSVILFLIMIFSIFVNLYLFMFAVISVCFISWNEFRGLIKKIYIKKNSLKFYFNLLIILFLIVFFFSSLNIYYFEGSLHFFFYITSMYGI